MTARIERQFGRVVAPLAPVLSVLIGQIINSSRTRPNGMAGREAAEIAKEA